MSLLDISSKRTWHPHMEWKIKHTIPAAIRKQSPHKNRFPSKGLQLIIRCLLLDNEHFNNICQQMINFSTMMLYSGAFNTAHKCMKQFLIQKY